MKCLGFRYKWRILPATYFAEAHQQQESNGPKRFLARGAATSETVQYLGNAMRFALIYIYLLYVYLMPLLIGLGVQRFSKLVCG